MIELLKMFDMAFGQLPNEPNKNQVIYVENNLNPILKEYIESNLFRIKRIYKQYGLDFIYLTDWINKVSDNDLQRTAKYYIPWLKKEDLVSLRDACAINVKELQDRLVPKDAGGAVYSNENKFFKIDVSNPELFEEQFIQIAKAYGRRQEPNTRCSDVEVVYGPPMVFEDRPEYNSIPEKKQKRTVSPAENEDELIGLFNRVRNILPEWAIKQMLMDKLQQHEVISRIEISHRRIIYLPDYDISIRLRPVEMAFYILYLKHPEGINFKDLADYRDELMRYYKHYATTTDLDSMNEAINNVVNPLKENNKDIQRSRIQRAINEAFAGKFCEAYAKQYIITGRRGEDKMITLPREMVIWLVDL